MLFRKIRKDIESHEKELISEIDVFIFIFLSFCNITSSLSNTNKYCNFIGVVLIFLAGLYFLHDFSSIISPFSIAFTLFTLFAFFSTFWSPTREYSMLAVRSISRILVLSVLLFNYLDTQRKKDLILSAFVVAGLAVSFYTILYYGIETFIGAMRNSARMGSDLYAINYVAVMLMVASVISLWFVFYRKKWWDIVPAFICCFVALGTGSRAAVICLIAGVMALVFLSCKGKWKLITPLLLVLLMLVSFYVIKLPPFKSVYSRMSTFLAVFTGEGEVDGSSSIRIKMIGWGFKQFLKNPLFGLGVSSGSVVMAEYGSDIPLYHNTYIEVLSGLGIIGFCLYFFMLFYPLAKLFKPAMQRKGDAVIAMVLLIMLLVGFVFGSEYTEKQTYFIIIFLFLSVSHYKREKE